MKQWQSAFGLVTFKNNDIVTALVDPYTIQTNASGDLIKLMLPKNEGFFYFDIFILIDTVNYEFRSPHSST
ncbi:hypothetical protein LX92_00092 [Maribacter polysiphoniae]|uniref:Uncharacterized protein n=1 Tax=Maribacter polysiphoniae TaxID=429344 RepID=A0A316E9D0_9FLAO|nr:hypothetical protein LX92_00092 [Maribacter polysiphoniae]